MRRGVAACTLFALTACSTSIGTPIDRLPDDYAARGYRVLAKPAPLPRGHVTFDCGPEALCAVLQYYNLPADVLEVTRLIYDPRKNGTYSPKIPELARQKGLANELVTGSVGRLKGAVDRERPAMIMVQIRPDLFHFFVVIGYSDLERKIVCEEYGGMKRLIDYDELLEIWKPRWCLEFFAAGAGEEIEAAKDLERNGEYAAAIAHYARGLAKEPDAADGWVGLANCLLMLRHVGPARLAYELGLWFDPRQLVGLISYADLLVTQGESLERALELADRGVLVAEEQVDTLKSELTKAAPENRDRIRRDLEDASYYLSLAYGTLGQARAAAGSSALAISAFMASFDLMKPAEHDRRAPRLVEIGDEYQKMRMGHEARLHWKRALLEAEKAKDDALKAAIEKRLN